jgi:hypothetical protein
LSDGGCAHSMPKLSTVGRMDTWSRIWEAHGHSVFGCVCVDGSFLRSPCACGWFSAKARLYYHTAILHKDVLEITCCLRLFRRCRVNLPYGDVGWLLLLVFCWLLRTAGYTRHDG